MSAALEAVSLPTASLPVIDISGWRAGTSTSVIEDMRRACLDKGFFYVTGHGLPDALVASLFEEAKAFFALPIEEKCALDKKLSPANRGYERLLGQTLERGSPADLKEGFYLGADLPPDDPRVVAGKFNHGANQWPPNRPRFKTVMERYLHEMLALADTLMVILGHSLDVAPDFFDGFRKDPLTVLRLLHYPPQPENADEGQKGAGAHTDFGGLTLLLQDEVGGLQVFDEATGGWIHAPPVKGAFVVNLGDMIARWTNDRYHSTMHRVVNASGRERYSVPFFYSGNPDFEVRCIESCLGVGEIPKHATTTVETHLREMYAKTYG